MSEKRIVKKSLEDIRRDLAEGKDCTDWERLQAMTDADIEQAVRADPDAVLLDEEWFRAARVVVPSGGKEQISIRLGAGRLHRQTEAETARDGAEPTGRGQALQRVEIARVGAPTRRTSPMR